MDAKLGYQDPAVPTSELDAESATTSQGTVIRERIILAGPQSNDDGHTFVPSPGTAIQLASHECRYIIISASQMNMDVVVVGGPNVVAGNAGDTGRLRKGTPLFPNQSMQIYCNNINQLWIDAVSATDGISWSYFI